MKQNTDSSSFSLLPDAGAYDPIEDRLRANVRATIEAMFEEELAEFLGRLSDEDIRVLYRRASVTLLPGEEDFGIVPLEAMACGRPVVALGRGGALETVVPDVTGKLVDDLSVEAFADAVDAACHQTFDSAAIREHAQRFGRERFGDEIETWVNGPLEPAVQ